MLQLEAVCQTHVFFNVSMVIHGKIWQLMVINQFYYHTLSKNSLLCKENLEKIVLEL